MGHRIDRRDFLEAGGLALGGLLLGGSSPARARSSLGAGAPKGGAASGIAPAKAARRARIRKALKIGMIGGGDTLEGQFRLARACGFEGVELDNPSDLDPVEVLAAKEAAGIEIPGVVDSVHWKKTLGDPDPSVRAEGRAALETALRDCARYGGTSVLLVPAVVTASISYADAYTRSQEEIRRVLPLARELGVRIAIENVWNHFLLSPLEAARYVDELDPAWVGWHLDAGNLANFGWAAQWIRILGSRVLKLDIKGFSRRKRDEKGLWKGFEVAIGDGDVNWPSIRESLDDIGYDGWASAEVAGGGEARLRDIAGRMDRVLGLEDGA